MKLLLLLSILFLFSCSDEQITQSIIEESHKEIILSKELYNNAIDDEFNFASVSIEGDSLKITIEYGGGCGNVTVNLIDSKYIMESWPVQRNIRISLYDNDDCEALITKHLSFDLTPLRVAGYSEVMLNLSGWGGNLLYEY